MKLELNQKHFFFNPQFANKFFFFLLFLNRHIFIKVVINTLIQPNIVTPFEETQFEIENLKNELRIE